jgi:hypothetical protein
LSTGAAVTHRPPYAGTVLGLLGLLPEAFESQLGQVDQTGSNPVCQLFKVAIGIVSNFGGGEERGRWSLGRNMAKQYAMKDLGYQRTPTKAIFRVEMPDGSKWDVPVQAIVDSRDEHYSDEQEDTIGFIRAGSPDKYKISDWAGNNMNWDEVMPYAVKASIPPVPVDYQEGWCNGEKEIVGAL